MEIGLDYSLPNTLWVRMKKKKLCETLSNFRNHVSMDDYSRLGLKFFDCYTLMQQLLLLELKNCLLENVRFAIIRLCFFFNSLWYKAKLDSLSKLQNEIDTALCNLE